MYSRELSIAKFQLAKADPNRPRESSTNSNSSTGGMSRFTNKLSIGSAAQDNTSLVRQALKNQKRNQKIVATINSQTRQPDAISTANSNNGSASAVARIQRLRASSQIKMEQALAQQSTQQPPQFIKVASNLPRASQPKISGQVAIRSLSNGNPKIVNGLVS